MTTLLSIETSSTLCSLALHRSGRWIEHTQNVARMHNQVVLGMLDELMRDAAVAPGDLDAVAFASGPGSFTGIRIAAALAQGIAFAAGTPVVPVSSSLALAMEALGQLGPRRKPRGVFTITPSRRDAYYLAGFELRQDGLSQTLQDALHQGENAPPWLPGADWVAVGARPAWLSPEGPLELLEGCQVRAETVGRLGLAALSGGGGVDAAEGLPRYVSGDTPWRPAGA
jgi:tRNA threonylcarbamoyladenosine biosynthesis protein TsaB